MGSDSSNNNINSSRILYNFYNTTEVYISANFNGTIFAPFADVTSSENCVGHLSGAIIAQSFYGGEEIGYRPFLGSIDILGTSSGYALPVDKVDTDGDFVEGVTLTLYDEDDKYVTSITSSSDTEYIDIPTALLFDGMETCSTGDSVTTKYTLKETKAPDGYIITDTEYTITAQETIKEINSDKIPTQVEVVITVTKSDDSSYSKSYKFTYTDGYSSSSTTTETTDNGTNTSSDDYHNSRIIALTNFNPIKTFTITIGSDGKVMEVVYGGSDITTTISTATGSITADGEFTTSDGCTYYYDPSTYMIMYVGDGSLEFVNSTGLQFQKIDEDGNSLSGATISLTSGTLSLQSGSYSNTTTVLDDILSGESKVTLYISDLKTASASDTDHVANIYCLSETSAPNGYEVAADIYFALYNDTIYWISTDAVSNITSTITITGNQGGGPGGGQGQSNNSTLTFNSDWNTIDTDDLADSSSVVTMTDILIDGAKVMLQKINSATNGLITSGATLEVYDENDQPIATVTDGDTTLPGYLESGVYYIVETKVPDGYKDTLKDEKIYFTVNSDHSVTEGKPEYVSYTVSPASGVENYQVWAYGSASNVTKIEIYLSNPTSGTLVFYETGIGSFDGKTVTVTDGVATYTPDSMITSLGDFKIQNNSYNDGLTVTEVRVYGKGSGSSSTNSYTVYYTLNYASGGNSGEQSFTAKSSDWNCVQNFSVSTYSVTSVDIRLEDDVTADYFEVLANDWSNGEKATSSIMANSVTLTLNSASTDIKQIGVSGLVRETTASEPTTSGTVDY